MNVEFTSLDTMLDTFETAYSISGVFILGAVLIIAIISYIKHRLDNNSKEQKELIKQKRIKKKQDRIIKKKQDMIVKNIEIKGEKALDNIGCEPESKGKYETLTLRFDNKGRVIDEQKENQG